MSLRRKPLTARTSSARSRAKKTTPPPRKRTRDTGFPPAVKVLIHARSGGRCEVQQQCRGAVAVHIHHRRPRGSGGSTLAWVSGAANGVDVCLACHAFIESARAYSEGHGWLVSMNRRRRSDEVPVLLVHDSEPVLLADDGTFHRPTEGD
ncbi:5-methylcytosine-specific restriction protein A [Rhodococcus sp. 27YEA15]